MSPRIARRGLLFVLSSPSGAGKTTLTRRLLKADKTLKMSVSVTTRPKRPLEKNGRDYYFVSPQKFNAMVKRGDLLEHAVVFGNCYGTPRKPVEAALAKGRDVIFDIDWQGTQQLRRRAGKDVVSVFILPPSRATLARRLKSRAQDTPAVVAARMKKSNKEISHWREYDYVVINDDLARALASVRAILEVERMKRHRQTGLPQFVRRLMKGR